MKLKYRIFYSLLLVGLLGATPLCYAGSADNKTSIKDVKRETQELLRALGSYTVEQKNEAIAKTKTAMDELDQRIDALENRVDESWDEMDESARKKARAQLKSLHRERARLAEWYGGLKGSTGEAWKHMKEGFSDAYQSINDAWARSEKEFGSKK